MSYSQEHHAGMHRQMELIGKNLYRIAVYGTLRSGEPNHPLINGDPASRYINTDYVRGMRLYALNGPVVPIAVPTGNEKDRIVVEVYDVGLSTRESVDSLEGVYGNQGYGPYMPVVVETELGYRCRVYVAKPSYRTKGAMLRMKGIVGGDYSKWRP